MTKKMTVSWDGENSKKAVLDVSLNGFTSEDSIWVLRDMFHTMIGELGWADEYSIRVMRSPKPPELPSIALEGSVSDEKARKVS